MGEEGDITLTWSSKSSGNGSFAADLNLLGGLPIGATMGPDGPVGNGLSDRRCRDPFVIAVVPFDDV